MIRRAAFALVVLASSTLVGGAKATAPTRYSEGLPVHTTGDTHSGIVVLRPPPGGRVHIAGGTFTMGSNPMDMLRGVQMCQHEPLGSVIVPIEDVHGVVHRRSAHCDVSRFEVEALAHSVTLSPYFIDRTEVRVEDYMRCVSAGACGHPGFTPGDPRFARPEFPVVLVSWDDARDYCTFAKGRLPTEAEWEFAARGTEGRTFPWGHVYNPRLSNHGSVALDPTDATDGFAGLAPVGSIPDGRTPLGLLDMAGNAAEWVSDAYDPDTTSISEVPPYLGAPETNPRHDVGARRVIRGGSYMQGADAQRSAARLMTYPTRRLPYLGFRCASDS